MAWHTEECCNRNCRGGCHAGELECSDCGHVWAGEWDDAPDECPECGEPWADAGMSDAEERACERRQMGIC